MNRPTWASEAGRAYLDLQNRARGERRGTQKLLTLYVVERWLARLSASPHVDKFVIKGGMLLAADVARLPLNDGVDYFTETATSRIIRDQAIYSGVRIALAARSRPLRSSSTSMSTSATRSRHRQASATTPTSTL